MRFASFMTIAAAACFSGASTGFAQAPSSRAVAQSPAEYTDGEVLEVDVPNATAVLRHGFIRNLGMDPMAMEFDVKDRALLARLKVGDKVRFKAVYQDGKYMLIEVRPRK